MRILEVDAEGTATVELVYNIKSCSDMDPPRAGITTAAHQEVSSCRSYWEEVARKFVVAHEGIVAYTQMAGARLVVTALIRYASL